MLGIRWIRILQIRRPPDTDMGWIRPSMGWIGLDLVGLSWKVLVVGGLGRAEPINAIIFVALSYVWARLSVHLSVTHRYWLKTNDRRVMRFSPSGSPGTLSFWHQLSYAGSQWNQLGRTLWTRLRWVKSVRRWFSTNKSLYLANDRIDRHIVTMEDVAYNLLIGTNFDDLEWRWTTVKNYLTRAFWGLGVQKWVKIDPRYQRQKYHTRLWSWHAWFTRRSGGLGELSESLAQYEIVYKTAWTKQLQSFSPVLKGERSSRCHVELQVWHSLRQTFPLSDVGLQWLVRERRWKLWNLCVVDCVLHWSVPVLSWLTESKSVKDHTILETVMSANITLWYQ